MAPVESTQYCAQQGKWTAMNSPVKVPLNAVWGLSYNSFWAVGDSGVVLHFDGRMWRQTTRLPASTLIMIDGKADDDIYAAGWEATTEGPVEIRAYHYNGKEWRQLDRSIEGQVRGGCLIGKGTLLLVGENTNQARYWLYKEGSWKEGSADAQQLRDAKPLGENEAIIVGEKGTIRGQFSKIYLYKKDKLLEIRSEEDAEVKSIGVIPDDSGVIFAGEKYTDAADHPLIIERKDGEYVSEILNKEGRIKNLWIGRSKNRLAVGDDGLVLRDNGRGWHWEDPGTAEPLNGAYGDREGNLFAVGERGGIYRYSCTHNEPVTIERETCDFEEIISREKTEFYGMWAQRPERVFIASTTGMWILRDESELERIWTKGQTGLESVWGYDEENVYGVGIDFSVRIDDGKSMNMLIVKCNESGCDEISPMIKAETDAVYGFSPGEIYTAGSVYENGRPRAIFGKIDSSDTWKQMPINIDGAALRGLWGTSPENLYVTGWTFVGDGAINYSRIVNYDGSQWTMAIDEIPTDIKEISGTGENDIWAVGSVKGESRYKGTITHFDGTAWKTAMNETERYSAVWSHESGTYIGGTTWLDDEQRYEVAIWKRENDDWRKMTCCTHKGSDTIEGIWSIDDSEVLAITAEASILRYRK